MKKLLLLILMAITLAVPVFAADFTVSNIIWYSFDNNTNSSVGIYDQSATPYPAAKKAATEPFLTGEAQLENATNYDGTDDYASRAEIAAVITKTADYTVCLWFKADDTTTEQFIWTQQTGVSDRHFVKIQSNKVAVGAYEGVYDYVETAFSDTASFHHLCVVATSGDYVGYLDSVKFTDNSMTIDGIASTADKLVLGGNEGGSNTFNGIIDEFGVWSINHTSADITALYSSGNGINPYTDITAPTITWNTIAADNSTEYFRNVTPDINITFTDINLAVINVTVDYLNGTRAFMSYNSSAATPYYYFNDTLTTAAYYNITATGCDSVFCTTEYRSFRISNYYNRFDEIADAYSLKWKECDISTTANSIMLGVWVFAIVAIFGLCLWAKIPILSILVGFVTCYFAWYVANCFLFANMLFIVMGLVLILHGTIYAWIGKTV